MALAIGAITANTATPGKYSIYELGFAVSGISPADYNPWRPAVTSSALSKAGVVCQAVITLPDASTVTVPGFYDSDFEYLGQCTGFTGHDRFCPTNVPYWHIRYMPQTAGAHSAVVSFTDQTGTVTADAVTFTCVASSNKGQIVTGSGGFSRANGDPYVPIGAMLPTDTDDALDFLDEMYAHGMNFSRCGIVNTSVQDVHRGYYSDWGGSAFTTAYDTSVKRTGAQSLRATVTSGSTERKVIEQTFIGVRPSTYYKATCYIKTNSTFNGTAKLKLRLKWADGSETTAYSDGVEGNADWTAVTATVSTVSATKSAEWISWNVVVDASSTAGSVWVDDATLVECDSGYTDLGYVDYLFRPGFEAWNTTELDRGRMWRFEHLLSVASGYGITLQPAVFDYRLYMPEVDGMYLDYYADFFSTEESLLQQEYHLRSMAARWACYDSLFAWELSNELDPTYTAVRGAWITRLSAALAASDPTGRIVTNSTWYSPGDVGYAALSGMDANQVHYYLNTEERTTPRGVPFWGNFASGYSLETTQANCYAGSKCMKCTPNGTTRQWSIEVPCKAASAYTNTYRIRSYGFNGQFTVQYQYYKSDGTACSGSVYNTVTNGSVSWSLKTLNLTTPANCYYMLLTFKLTGTTGSVWIDNFRIDAADGRNLIFNSGFELDTLGEDEQEWAACMAHTSESTYAAGTLGLPKPYIHGEFGLMGAGGDLSLYADPDDTTKSRHDSTGIHAHNGFWATLMATKGLHTPAYWWTKDYIIPRLLYGIWDGLSAFCADLPFHDPNGAVRLCSNIPDFGAEDCTSSNAYIRLLGVKKGSEAYFWLSNSEATWANVVRDGVTPTAKSTDLAIEGFAIGCYDVTRYNTWTGIASAAEQVWVTDGVLRLDSEMVATDAAVIVTATATTPPDPPDPEDPIPDPDPPVDPPVEPPVEPPVVDPPVVDPPVVDPPVVGPPVVDPPVEDPVPDPEPVVPPWSDTNGVTTPLSDVTSVGDEAWLNPQYAGTDNDQYAYYGEAFNVLDYVTPVLRFQNFGFNPPVEVTEISGISVTLKARWATANPPAQPTVHDHTIRLLKAGTPTGDNKADAAHTWAQTVETRSFGGDHDLWGAAWTVDDIKDPGFGVDIQAHYLSQWTQVAYTERVYYVSITVYEGTTGRPMWSASALGSMIPGPRRRLGI